MYVRKVRGQNKTGKLLVTATEVAWARKHGLTLEEYAKNVLLIIAKQRRWKWFFKKESK